jgi:hypothetical protein
MTQDRELPYGDGRRFERLPEQIRRWQRFGGAGPAALAEALALRREIDRIAERLTRSLAGRRPLGVSDIIDDPDTQQATQRTWDALRQQGLAMVAEVARRRSNGCSGPDANADSAAASPHATDRASD